MNLLKREYLRGLIDGTENGLPDNYSIKTLNRRYIKYLMANPEVKKEIAPKKKTK